jgi:hypothetical protein
VPFDIPPVRELAQWDISNSNDPAINWFIAQMREVAEEQVPSSGPLAKADSKMALEFQTDRKRR